jgi:hypothetical protein
MYRLLYADFGTCKTSGAVAAVHSDGKVVQRAFFSIFSQSRKKVHRKLILFRKGRLILGPPATFNYQSTRKNDSEGFR